MATHTIYRDLDHVHDVIIEALTPVLPTLNGEAVCVGHPGEPVVSFDAGNRFIDCFAAPSGHAIGSAGADDRRRDEIIPTVEALLVAAGAGTVGHDPNGPLVTFETADDDTVDVWLTVSDTYGD